MASETVDSLKRDNADLHRRIETLVTRWKQATKERDEALREVARLKRIIEAYERKVEHDERRTISDD